MVNTEDDHRKLQIKEEEKITMKKMNLAGIIAAMTIAASTLSVPCMAQGQITEAQAKQIALADAGLTEDQVTFVRSQVDYDDGVKEFEVEFYAGNMEYDYDIDAASGAIRSKDQDCEFYAPTAGQAAGGAVTKEQALETALNHAGVSKADASYVQVHKDYDDGMEQFDVKFYVGMTEYSYDIDANTGRIVDYDIEIDD